MPGIVGLVTKMPPEQAKYQLQKMVAAIRHEEFYRTGTWIDEELGLYIGWVERKNSFSDEMPIRNESGDVILIFSGEEFPDPETRGSLKRRGHTLGDQPSSYLVHLYEEDPHFFADLNGRFHGFVVDRRCGLATLFNDRYGMHRVYFHESKDDIYFAAEAKAILAVQNELRDADLRGLGEFVACGCVLENRTLFRKIHVLPPSTAWTFAGKAIKRKQTYLQPSELEDRSQLDPESYYRTLRGVFTRNLPRYFTGNEPIGISLTGGLDTRMILAWHKSRPGGLPCYSFGGTYRDCADVTIARKLAKACGQPYQVIAVGEEFLSKFSYYAERAVYLTDGCVAVNRAADLYVNQIARAIAPVRMTGNYGSEVLRNSIAFRPGMPTAGLFRPDFVEHVTTAGRTYSELRDTHPLSFALFRQAPWYHYGLLALEQTQVSIRSPYLDNELVQTVYSAPNATLANNDVCLRLIADGSNTFHNIRTDRGYGGNSSGIYSKTLRELIEFTVKAEYAYDYGMPHWLARLDHALSVLRLERLFLGRHKFAHFRVWYRDALSEFVRQMLLDSRTLSRPYLDPSVVETIVRDHIKGHHNYTTEIHQLLTLEQVHRIFLD